TASGVDAREVIVLRLSQEEDGEAVTAALEAHRQARLADFFGYAPDQAALLEEAVVTSQDGYAALLVCRQPGLPVGLQGGGHCLAVLFLAQPEDDDLPGVHPGGG
ncbi:DUF4358 domain-containing protein, partial [Pseudoflavonifractor phocaeensis]|uniref:DUF4358 domain-containing protein n=1 Tax=Pseudoflavonifractor phocaeensis TaxID=1870988 RepID=UPI001956CBE1